MAPETFKVTRQKSCIPCAKAKRRCQPQSPQCPRCASKGLVCRYKNEPLMTRRSPVDAVYDVSASLTDSGSATPESISAAPQPSFGGGDTDLSSVFNLTDESLDETTLNQWVFQNNMRLDMTVRFPIDGFGEVACVDKWAEGELIRAFKSYPMMFARSRETPFIHAKLYDAWLPESIADVYNVTAAYCSRNKNTESMVLRIVEQKTHKLLKQDSTDWSLDEHLAAVQSLILLCTICLFDGDWNLRKQSHAFMTALNLMTAQLRARLPSLGSNPTWQAWLWIESLRRTILFAHFLEATYTIVKDGFCTMVPRIKSVPFTSKSSLWSAPSGLEWETDAKNTIPDTIHYGNFSEEYEKGTFGEKLDHFQKLLLIPCLGEKYREVLDIEKD